MARPTKFNKERAQRILEALRAGNTRRASAQYGGVSYDTFLDWLKRGEEEGKGEFFQFLHAVEQSEAECEVAMAAVIRKAATGYKAPKKKTVTSADGETVTVEEIFVSDWRAAESWLKRRRREDWGDSLDLRKLDDETIIRLLERDAAARGASAEAEHPATDAPGSG